MIPRIERNTMEIIAAMPVALKKYSDDNANAIFISLVIDTFDNNVHISKITENEVYISATVDGRDREVIFNKECILCAYQSINSNSRGSIEQDGLYISFYSYVTECHTIGLNRMIIKPLNVSLRDMRKWPLLAITSWAEYHLNLPDDQMSIIRNIHERWKIINAAQEMFTYQCSDYNEKAHKVVEKHKEEMHDILEDIELVGDAHYERRDNLNYGAQSASYHVTVPIPQTIKAAQSASIGAYFRDPESGRPYELVIHINKHIGYKNRFGISVSIPTSNKAYVCDVSSSPFLRQADLCILEMQFYLLL